jgi:glycosyltransferase involved in cell wall biosynthesis
MQQDTIQRQEGGRRTRGDARTERPLVSIITVVYNGGDALRSTLDSTFAQSYKDYELIIIDGASTDGTIQKLISLDNEIDYWLSERDGGIYDAMNKGLKIARGAWIYFLNAGDTFVGPHVLEQIAAELKKSNVGIVVGYVRALADGEVTGRFPLDVSKTDSARQLFGCKFCHQALFVRKQRYENIEGFDLRFSTFADFFACYQIVRKFGGFDHAPIEIANFDLGGVSSDYRKSARLYRERERIFQVVGEGKSPFLYFLGLCRAYAYRYKRTVLKKL